jgi:hypothetical protein
MIKKIQSLIIQVKEQSESKADPLSPNKDLNKYLGSTIT